VGLVSCRPKVCKPKRNPPPMLKHVPGFTHRFDQHPQRAIIPFLGVIIITTRMKPGSLSSVTTVHHTCRLSTCSSVPNGVGTGSAQPQVGAYTLALARCSACILLQTWTALSHSLTTARGCSCSQERVCTSLLSSSLSTLMSWTFAVGSHSKFRSRVVAAGVSFLDCQVEPQG
jgi:hypothetical protein